MPVPGRRRPGRSLSLFPVITPSEPSPLQQRFGSLPERGRNLPDLLQCTLKTTEASSCEEALGLIAAGSSLGLILLDLNLPGMDGMTGLSKLRDAAPATPFVVLSATENTAKIKRAISAGAKGYIPKSAAREIILSALRLVLSGGVYLPVNVMQAPASTDAEPLTPRQREVLRWFGRHKRYKGLRPGASPFQVREHPTRTGWSSS